MKKLFLFLFILSCAPPISNDNIKEKTLNFNEDLTFDEFKKLLIKYGEANSYPNIDG
jgi:hypothetical protein|tara:strand:+ start:136 stop:306 length:171 start_codon:yes stop_codon:yes gene_type:complete